MLALGGGAAIVVWCIQQTCAHSQSPDDWTTVSLETENDSVYCVAQATVAPLTTNRKCFAVLISILYLQPFNDLCT